jgi:hypothetical protein
MASVATATKQSKKPNGKSAAQRLLRAGRQKQPNPAAIDAAVAATTQEPLSRTILQHNKEGDASPRALVTALMTAESLARSPAHLAAAALDDIGDDLYILQVASESQNGPVDDIIEMAHVRLQQRAHAVAEIVRRLERDGTLEPWTVQP